MTCGLFALVIMQAMPSIWVEEYCNESYQTSQVLGLPTLSDTQLAPAKPRSDNVVTALSRIKGGATQVAHPRPCCSA